MPERTLLLKSLTRMNVVCGDMQVHWAAVPLKRLVLDDLYSFTQAV